MRTTLLKAVVTTGLFGVVQAADAQTQAQQNGGMRLSGDLSQTFEYKDNANLANSGSQIRSLTGLDFSLSSQTKTSTVSASTGIALRADDNGFSLARPKLNLGFETNSKLTTYSGSVSYAQAPVAVDEILPDLSILNVDADRTVISGKFGVTTKLNETTDLSFGLSGTHVDFDPLTATVSPTTDYGLSGAINYQLNRRTKFGLNAALGYFGAENATNTESLSASLGGRLSHKLTNASTFDGNLGLSFIDTTDTVGTATTSAFSVSLLFGAGLTQTLPDGSVGISLDQTVNPSASGSLALSTRLNGSIQRDVNPNVSYAIGASLGRQEDVGGGAVTTFINVSPSYSRQLTRDVSATASYFYQRDDAGASSQGLTISFTRPFDFPVR